MKRSFQISGGSKLSTDEYSTMVDKLAELLPSVNENVHILQNRYISLLTNHNPIPSVTYWFCSLLIWRSTKSYPLPTKRESDLILAYSKFIIKMGGRFVRVVLVISRVSNEYFSVVFNSVRKIPYYVITGIQKTDCLVLADFVDVCIYFGTFL